MRRARSIAIGLLAVYAAWVTIGNVMLRLQEAKGIPEADVALSREIKESFLDWQTIVEEAPGLAGYEIREDVIFRGETGEVINITITPESPFLWWWVRSVRDNDPFRCLSVTIALYEKEADLQRSLNTSPQAGFEVRESEVTVGFLEEHRSQLIPGRPGTSLTAFAGQHRLWVEFVISTELEAEPFMERRELERIMQIVKERLLEMNI